MRSFTLASKVVELTHDLEDMTKQYNEADAELDRLKIINAENNCILSYLNRGGKDELMIKSLCRIQKDNYTPEEAPVVGTHNHDDMFSPDSIVEDLERRLSKSVNIDTGEK